MNLAAPAFRLVSRIVHPPFPLRFSILPHLPPLFLLTLDIYFIQLTLMCDCFFLLQMTGARYLGTQPNLVSESSLSCLIFYLLCSITACMAKISRMSQWQVKLLSAGITPRIQASIVKMIILSHIFTKSPSACFVWTTCV